MPTDQNPDRREQIRRALAEADGFGFDSLEPHDYQRHADAILALLAVPSAAAPPTQADEAEALLLRFAAEERGRYHTAWRSARMRAQAYGEGVLLHVAQRDFWQMAAEQNYAAGEEQRLALSQALGLGTGAPWAAIRERAAELVVLSAPVDRAAILRDFLWRLEQSAGDAAAEKLLDDNPELRRLAEAPQPETQGGHVCKPGAATYFCPTSGETESGCHGGFGVCCDRPELHAPAVVAQPGKEADRG